MAKYRLEDLTPGMQEKIKTVKDTLQVMSYVTDDVIIQEVLKDHPCHQQAFIANLGRIILIFAEECKSTDTRNRNAHIFATAVANMIADDPTLMPFI